MGYHLRLWKKPSLLYYNAKLDRYDIDPTEPLTAEDVLRYYLQHIKGVVTRDGHYQSAWNDYIITGVA